ncbi:MAG: hypothetical protein IJU74_07825, partial [Bacteroidales bacterium]|nr:hypothetical protein [Bacteroidales bacterium]
ERTLARQGPSTECDRQKSVFPVPHPPEIPASRSAKALLRLSCLMQGEDKPDESHEYAGTADYEPWRSLSRKQLIIGQLYFSL